MGFSLRGVLIPLCVVLLSGCFQVETTVRVNKDGSGTIEERMMMSRKMISQFDEMAKAFAGEGEKPKPFSLRDEAKLRARAEEYGPGVAFVSSAEIGDASYAGYRAVYSFKDINTVRLSQEGAKGMAGPEEKREGEGAKPFAFQFTPGRLVIVPPKNVPEKKQTESAEGEKAAGAEKSPPMTPEQEKEFVDMMKGMRVAMAVEMNADIVESNASHRQGNRVTLFEFDMDRMGGNMDKIRQLGKKNPASFADAKEALKDLPGFKVETTDRVEIKFAP
jgi:hypothetical protein